MGGFNFLPFAKHMYVFSFISMHCTLLLLVVHLEIKLNGDLLITGLSLHGECLFRVFGSRWGFPEWVCEALSVEKAVVWFSLKSGNLIWEATALPPTHLPESGGLCNYGQHITSCIPGRQVTASTAGPSYTHTHTHTCNIYILIL